MVEFGASPTSCRLGGWLASRTSALSLPRSLPGRGLVKEVEAGSEAQLLPPGPGRGNHPDDLASGLPLDVISRLDAELLGGHLGRRYLELAGDLAHTFIVARIPSLSRMSSENSLSAFL